MEFKRQRKGQHQPKIASYKVFAYSLNERTGRKERRNITTIQARGEKEANLIGAKFSKLMSMEFGSVVEEMQ